MNAFEDDVAGIGALAEPARRGLYMYVCAQPAPVSREQAADALGMPLHSAKFHLDRLEAEGLLETGYARRSGRVGPGAGRPAKLYRRADREIAVSLPHREYELAGQLMAQAIAASAETEEPVLTCLNRAAEAYGSSVAESIQTGRPVSAAAALNLATRTMVDLGYEPRREGDATVLVNCPFHALAQEHTALVCHMNHALLSGLVDRLAGDQLETRLEPGANRCCVVVAAAGARPAAEPIT